jgi:hypothetical protein
MAEEREGASYCRKGEQLSAIPTKVDSDNTRQSIAAPLSARGSRPCRRTSQVLVMANLTSLDLSHNRIEVSSSAGSGRP